jgi:hypothetical protein
MATARPETLKKIKKLQTVIQPHDGCVIQFSSVRFYLNPIQFNGMICNIGIFLHINVVCYLHEDNGVVWFGRFTRSTKPSICLTFCVTTMLSTLCVQ